MTPGPTAHCNVQHIMVGPRLVLHIRTTMSELRLTLWNFTELYGTLL